MNFRSIFGATAIATAAVCLSLPASAQGLADLPAPEQANVEADVEALDQEDLQDLTAGETTKVEVLSNQQLTATNTGNSVAAETVTSGNVSFSGGALDGFSGVGNFVANTGNNNNLQGSISINIVTAPATP